jgi:membrane protein implicated in regulation of membrane protease activity
MNRTRFIFLLALAVCLLILAASLARQVISTDRLLQIYVASTIFAGGVVLLDVAGVLGGHHADGFAGNDVAGHDFAGPAAGGHDLGGHDLGGHEAGGHDGAGNGHTAPGHAGEHVAAEDAARAVGSSEAQATTAAHLEARTAPPSGNAAPILSILAYLRLLVYFCLGFGPAGWAGLASGWGALRSLLLAVPIGLLALFAARAFFRFQRRDTGAVPAEIDLLHEKAEVIVPLDDETMGKVRVSVGMSVSDLYALAAERGRHYERGDVVQIVQVTDDCVRVR